MIFSLSNLDLAAYFYYIGCSKFCNYIMDKNINGYSIIFFDNEFIDENCDIGNIELLTVKNVINESRKYYDVYDNYECHENFPFLNEYQQSESDENIHDDLFNQIINEISNNIVDEISNNIVDNGSESTFAGIDNNVENIENIDIENVNNNVNLNPLIDLNGYYCSICTNTFEENLQIIIICNNNHYICENCNVIYQSRFDKCLICRVVLL